MEFKPFHDYNKMVRRNAAEPLKCPECKTEYTLRMAAFTEEPYLQCYGCNSSIKPGLRLYNDIVKITNEYFKR